MIYNVVLVLVVYFLETTQFKGTCVQNRLTDLENEPRVAGGGKDMEKGSYVVSDGHVHTHCCI